MSHRTAPISIIAFVAIWLVPSVLWAFPGFVVGKREAERTVHSTHVVVMKKGDTSVVTVMPDYDGPLEPFAVVLAVPSDVTEERLQTLRRDFVDRIDQMSAPRFHEFWEMDPCEPGQVIQEWERDMSAQASTGFLGGGMPTGTRKVPKEMLLSVEPEFKKHAEYGMSLVPEGQSVIAALKAKGYVVPAAAAKAVEALEGKNVQFVISEVDTAKIELTGGDRAVLSPIRFWTEKPFEEIHSELGLLNLGDSQELFVYVLHPDQRFETKSYKTIFPPTNIEVAFVVKERMGEFYNALYDLMLQKNPKSFAAEYAWHTENCGEPCPNESLIIHELLSLGGDVFEQQLPEEEAHPEPPEMTEEEQKKLEAELEAAEPKARKDLEKERAAERKELARRQALVARQKYVLSRLHYRYDKSGLDKPVTIGPAHAVRGGVGLPKGPEGELPTQVEKANTNKFQTRYVHFHPNKIVVKCDEPQRWRWAKPPRTYRGLRKIWVADDLARKSRTQIQPAKVVLDPVPSLGLAANPREGDDADDTADGGLADGGALAADGEKSRCGCRVPGGANPHSLAWLLALGAVMAGARIRRAEPRR
jgi:MYXO-CTERM domain-containing protein